MARSQVWTERWIPKDSTELKAPEANAVAYLYGFGSKLAAVGYSGKRNKPDFHTTYHSEKQRLEHLNRWRKGLADSIAFKAALQAERKAHSDQGHSIPVGAIFNFSWGYEQTNQDFSRW